jgi:short-subunit dehydrogenase
MGASDTTVLVTGASSGIGRASVLELARRIPGAHLLLVARRKAALDETIELAGVDAAPGVTFEAIACDLADPVALDRLVDAVLERTPRLDALVNNAGVGTDRPFKSRHGLEDADQMLALNLRAPIALCHGLLPRLALSGGTIVNVSSVAGLVGTPGSAVYSATKFGLSGFSETLRARVAPLGVRVVCVHPGPVPTPGWPQERLASRPVAGRLFAASPEAIARTVTRAVQGRGGVSPIRPRTFWIVPPLRALAPWLVRGLLAAAVRGGATSGLAGRAPEGTAP